MSAEQSALDSRLLQAQLSSAVASASLGRWVLECGTGACSVDERTRAIFGLDAPEIHIDDWFVRIHPGDRERVQRDVQGAIAGAANLFLECRVVHPDGRLRWVLLRACFVDGEVSRTRLAGVVQDVTATASQSMNDTEERLRLTLEAADIGAYEFLPLTRQMFWDDRTARIWEMPSGATLDQVIERVHPEDREAIRGAYAAVVKPGSSGIVFYQHRILLPDGRIRWLVNRGRCYFEGEGEHRRAVRNVGVCVDITDQKRLEQYLRDSQASVRAHAAELEAILDAVPVATFISRDREGRHMINSRMTYELLRLPAGANVSMTAPEGERPTTFRIVANGTEIPVHELPAHKAAATGETIRDYELDLAFEDGTSRTLFGNAVPILDENGEPRGSVAAFIDITERKRAELELQATAEALRKSNEELQQFAYIVSHDLQQPLRAISTYSELIERQLESLANPALGQWLHYIRDGAARMRQLISDLLSYSRFEHTLTMASNAEVDMSAVAGFALSNLSHVIQESGAVVTYDRLPAARGDFGRYLQLMENLIGNAIKYRTPDVAPAIQITGSREGDFCLFSIRDNGIGISGDYHERIFGLFKRLHGPNEYPGTGIGLAICKKIVQHHGGRIWVESEVGHGATFYFTLPAASEQVEAATP